MTVGVQADRLYVGDTLVWDGGTQVVRGVPSVVAFDCDNYSASSAALAWGPVEVQAGDVLVMAVLRRVPWTAPEGWTVHATATFPYLSGGQSVDILTRRVTEGGVASGVVAFSAPARVQVGVLVVRGVSEVVERPDLTLVTEDKRGNYSFSIPGKGRPGTVVWALSVPFWDTGAGSSFPYASAQVRPWSATPAMWAPEWTPTSNTHDNSRLGMFLDVSDPGPRTFTSTTVHADDWVGVVAIELVGV